MTSLGSILDALSVDLSDDDILFDCATCALDVVDLAILIDEVLIRRNANSLTLLRPDPSLAHEARRMADEVGRGDRLLVAD